jgi:hypothetical protein
MQEPKPQWFFQPRGNRNGARRGESDPLPGLINMPEAMLQRHGAKELNPGIAAAVHDQVPPRPTIYRTRTLLVPDDLLQQAPKVRAINAVLAGVGMALRPPAPERLPDLPNAEVARELARLPRPAVLVLARDGRTPTVIDAWPALQALRAAATHPPHQAMAAAGLTQADIDRIRLEHLLVGSAIDGSPIGHSGGGLTGGTNGGSGVTGPGTTDSYTFSGGDTRTPVTVLLDPPDRGSAGECGRRPVVAVLDTGVRAHPWLDVRPNPHGGGYDTDPNHDGDGFTSVDLGIQQAILAEGSKARAAGDRLRQLIRNPWDTPVAADPLVGELDTDTGHGTFISGIVRQIAPKAKVLALRIMHSDGTVYEGDLICALRQLAARIAQAEAGDAGNMVDVVSLSLGYFDETSHDEDFTSGLRHAIEILLGLGVIVVAAAGNFSTSRRFYPAAFATSMPPAGLPVISVGALNPNGSKAIFSDGGAWVTAWASGAAVVSTMPADVNASRAPAIRMREHPANPVPPGSSLPRYRESLDADDYSGLFGQWSGTSFSAPILAAHIARALLEEAARSGRKLTSCGTQDTLNRARAALTLMNWPGDRDG